MSCQRNVYSKLITPEQKNAPEREQRRAFATLSKANSPSGDFERSSVKTQPRGFKPGLDARHSIGKMVCVPTRICFGLLGFAVAFCVGSIIYLPIRIYSGQAGPAVAFSCTSPAWSQDHNNVETFRLGTHTQLSVKAVDINRAKQEN